MDKLNKAVPYSKLYVFIVWPIAGILLLIYSIINFNVWGKLVSSIVIIIGLFLVIYGIWATKRALARI